MQRGSHSLTGNVGITTGCACMLLASKRYHPGEFILKENLIPVSGKKLQQGFHQTLGSRRVVTGGGREYKRHFSMKKKGKKKGQRGGEEKRNLNVHAAAFAPQHLRIHESSLLHCKSSSHAQTRLL